MSRVLVACEFSGTVRRAFAAKGHDAWSCDLLAAEDGSNQHYVGDARDYLHLDWDLLIVCHPPCTRLCNAGVRWLNKAPPGRTIEEIWQELDEGASLFSDFWNAPIERICVENPVMHRYAKERIRNYAEFSQSFQPWQFETVPGGPDDQKKRVCLWLKNLPNLVPADTLDGSTAVDRVFRMPPGSERQKERSRFFPSVAKAMADQWVMP